MVGAEWFGSGRGGLNRYFTDLFVALERRADVEVAASAFGTAPDGGKSWGPATGSLRSRVRRSGADTVPDGTILDRHFALFGKSPRTHNGPVVTHFHGPWSQESAAAGESSVAVMAKRRWERRRYRDSDCYVVLSTHFRDVLVDRYDVPAERISVIPPGVDLDRFRTSAVPDAPPVVLCVRRLERRMGIDTLITSWPRVRRDHPDARLVIVGTGTAGTELMDQAAQSTHSASITFAGETTDAQLGELYRRATLTVVPTRSLEGFGLIALESLATGRAPVVTDVGGLPDSVRGFDDSLIVAPGDVEALADRVSRGLSGELPTPARCRSRAELFSWDACADAHLIEYRKLL